jgi:hypothetical protein
MHTKLLKPLTATAISGLLAVACGAGNGIDPSALGQLFATYAPGEAPQSAPATLTGSFELANDYHQTISGGELNEVSSWKVDVRLRAAGNPALPSYTYDGSTWTYEGRVENYVLEHVVGQQLEPCRGIESERTFNASGDFKDSFESHRYITGRTGRNSDNSLALVFEAAVETVPGEGTQAGTCDSTPVPEEDVTFSVSLGCHVDQIVNNTVEFTWEECLRGATGGESMTITGQLVGR